MSKIESHRDLLVWQKGMELAAEAYRLAGLLPKAEEYRLPRQMLRAAASVSANIAEGHARGTRKDYANFISISRGSLAETDTFLLLAVRTKLLSEAPAAPALSLANEKLLSEAPAAPALSLANELDKMLNVLRQRLSPQPLSPIPHYLSSPTRRSTTAD